MECGGVGLWVPALECDSEAANLVHVVGRVAVPTIGAQMEAASGCASSDCSRAASSGAEEHAAGFVGKMKKGKMKNGLDGSGGADLLGNEGDGRGQNGSEETTMIWIKREMFNPSNRKVEEGDVQQLYYLKLVIKEVLRLHPHGPLLAPRECMQDCKINGCNIPKKTRVYINAWAISRDPRYWQDPEAFIPERFEDNDINFKGQHFEFIPFGSGRRICAGMSLGVVSAELALANLLYRFDWDLPGGMSKEDINMEEQFGLVIRRKSPLILVATPTSVVS
ncbi:cytochrome P450 71B38-like [Elaeis guineensis]|uniref:cytochrome P450 71B38-like n=1 Tax=Elaeis guineensis var. tenera TaxID=51953 RepID=UPI003C6D8519